VGAGIEGAGAGAGGEGAGGEGAGAWLAGTSGLCAAVDAASSGSSPSELGCGEWLGDGSALSNPSLGVDITNETSVPTERLIN